MSVGNRTILNQNEQNALNALNAQIEKIALDVAFGEYTDLFVDVVVEIDNTDSSVPMMEQHINLQVIPMTERVTSSGMYPHMSIM